MPEKIIIPIEDRYKRCDSWSPFLNTIYLYFGIPILVTLIVLMILLLIYLISYLFNKNTTVDGMLNTYVMTFIMIFTSLIPIILTYKHVISIKKNCYTTGKTASINELPIATLVSKQ